MTNRMSRLTKCWNILSNVKWGDAKYSSFWNVTSKLRVSVVRLFDRIYYLTLSRDKLNARNDVDSSSHKGGGGGGATVIALTRIWNL